MVFYRITRKKDVRLRKQLNKLKRSLSYRKGVKALRKANPGNAAPVVPSFTLRLQRELLIKKLPRLTHVKIGNGFTIIDEVPQPAVQDSLAAARFRQGEDAVRNDFLDATQTKLYVPDDRSLQNLIDSPEFQAVIQKPMILPISVADYQKDTDEK